MMPEQSWGWLLRPGRGTTPSLLLAATGAQRAVMTIEWDTNGQLVFAGSSEDANSSAVDDLTARMLDAGGGEQGPLDQALLWGAWRQVGTQGPASTNGAPTTDGLSSSPSAGPSNTTPGRDTGTTVREGTKTWAIPIAPLTAALVGERQRARAINLGSAGAVICAFPHPGTPSSYDVTADGTQHQDLMGVLGTITQPDAPLPIAGLPGLRQSWVAQKALGALGTYRSLDGKPWAFWTLAP